MLDNADHMHSVQFVLNYDPSVEYVGNVALGAGVPDGNLSVEQPTPGTIIVVILNLTYDITASEVELVTFDTLIMSPNRPRRRPLTFDAYRTNNGVPSVISGLITRMPLAEESRSWGDIKGFYR